MSEQKKKPRPDQKTEVINGITYKYFADGTTVFAKGKMENGKLEGYWEWYRPDGTLKRSGSFDQDEPIGEWITYDPEGKPHKITQR